MALSITFYDNIKYSKDDFINRDRDFYGNGVVKLNDFPLGHPETPDLTVRIGRGAAWVDGYRIANDDAAIQLTFEAGRTQPRIDIVQLGHDDFLSQAVLTVKQGVAAANPIEPGEDNGFIKLYAVRVAEGATAIRPEDVKDRRSLVPLKVTGQQIVYEGAATTGANAYSGTQTAPQFEATGATPIKLISQTTLPEQPVPAGTITVVGGKWQYSDGSEWLSMAPEVSTATPAQEGIVQVAATTAAGSPVAATRVASANDVPITGTNPQTIASHTPAVKGNYQVQVYLVVTAQTTITVQISFSDRTGARTMKLIDAATIAADGVSTLATMINAAAGTPINITITAGAANVVYASAVIMGV